MTRGESRGCDEAEAGYRQLDPVDAGPQHEIGDRRNRRDLGKRVELIGNTSWLYRRRRSPSLERGNHSRWPATSSQNRSCSERFRTRCGADEARPNRRAGGSGTVDCFASLEMTGRAQWVSSIVVGRRLRRHSSDERRLRSEARRSSLVIAMASSRRRSTSKSPQSRSTGSAPTARTSAPAATIAGRTATEHSGGCACTDRSALDARSIAALRCKSGELEPGRCERSTK